MKIIILSHLFPGENEEFNGTFNLSRAKALMRMGHEVIIIKPVCITPPLKDIFRLSRLKKNINTISRMIKMPEKNVYDGIPVISLKWFPLPKKYLWWEQIYLFNLCIGREIKNIINRINPDAIITAVAHPEGTFSRYLKEYCICPIISIAEGSEVLIYPKLYRGIRKIVDSLNNYSDKVVFVSESMASSAAEKYGFKKWSIIRNGFENSIFSFDLEQKPQAHKRILSVGSLEYNKGHEMLLEAMKDLPGWELTIVGDGRCYNQYSDYIRNNGLSGRVTLIKYLNQQELKKRYQSSGIFCIPSRSESFGISALEALACGLPVVASNTGVFGAIIESGVNGFILNELSPLCVKETLIKASEQKWDKEKISLSVKGYSWDFWAGEITSLIESINNDRKINAKSCINT